MVAKKSSTKKTKSVSTKQRKKLKSIKKSKKTVSKVKRKIVSKSTKTTKRKITKTVKKKVKKNIKIKKPEEKEIKKPEIKKKLNPEERKERKEVLNLFSDAYARQVMISLGGENALEIIRTYPCGQSDEELSKKLKVKISDIRSTLNKMHGEGFVVYNRKRDSQTGWYSYSWSINKRSIVNWAEKITKEKNDIFNPSIEKYYCKKCGVDSLVGFVTAAENEFKCSCCNKALEFLEKRKTDDLFVKIMPEQIKRRRLT